MEVEARVNQADGLHKNEVSLGIFALKNLHADHPFMFQKSTF